MKNDKFLVRVLRGGGVTIFSADGKIEYASLRKLKNGRVVRTFCASVCDGILSEGTHHYNIGSAISETKERIEVVLELKKPGK